jgi:hypothetical protein
VIRDVTNNSDRFVINSSGNVGIGSTSPSGLLHVNTPNSTSTGFLIDYNYTGSSSSMATLIRINSSVATATAFAVHRKDGSTEYNGFTVMANGQTLIGQHGPPTVHNDASLSVDGKVICRDFYVLSNAVWPDYVFANEYKLPSLKDVQSFYNANKHLPGVPTAKEIEEKGININEMSTIQMQKIEELTIYLVQLKEEVEQLKKENELLKNKLNK